MTSGKYYVVWAGHEPGIYFSWEECQSQVHNFPNARYKSFSSKEEAIKAYRGRPEDHIGILKSIVSHEAAPVNYESFPEINLKAIAVDGACSRNPGPVEYRGVRVGTGETVFHCGPLEGGTNNIGEYLALVHALALLDKMGDTTTPVYADSRTSLAWFRNRGSKTTIQPNEKNKVIMNLLERADKWVQTHPNIPNPVLKWNTGAWGEIPADFGRK